MMIANSSRVIFHVQIGVQFPKNEHFSMLTKKAKRKTVVHNSVEAPHPIGCMQGTKYGFTQEARIATKAKIVQRQVVDISKCKHGASTIVRTISPATS